MPVDIPVRAAVLGAALVGAAALTALLVRLRRKWTVVTVDGVSMAPTYRPGDRVLVRRIAAGSLRVGQVAVLQQMTRSGAWDTAPLPIGRVGAAGWYIKRIAALPGDPTPAELARVAGVPARAPIPDGTMLVLADNPGGGVDSRHWGLVPLDRVLGVVHRRMHQRD